MKENQFKQLSQSDLQTFSTIDRKDSLHNINETDHVLMKLKQKMKTKLNIFTF